MLNIYCDGACRGNPGDSGSGIAVFRDQRLLLSISGDFENGTNNTAELKAFLKALSIAKTKNETATIFTDSKYTINSVTVWGYSWKKNNWKKKKGDILNLELIKLAHELYEEIKDFVSVEYVKGHSGDIGNDSADKCANLAIDLKCTSWTKVEI